MKRYRVNIPSTVEELIFQQVLYISSDSVQNALRWEQRLRKSIRGIGDIPHGYAIDPAASERSGIQVRKMVFERTYLVFYRVNDQAQVVELVSFRHGARLPHRGEP